MISKCIYAEIIRRAVLLIKQFQSFFGGEIMKQNKEQPHYGDRSGKMEQG